VAVIQRGAVSFGDKALAAMGAGVIGIIFINDDADMVAPQLQKNSWPPELEESSVPAICLTKPDGERLSALMRSHEVLSEMPSGSGYATDVRRQINVRWWDLTAGWAARRIQKQWKRAVENRKAEQQVLEQQPALEEQAERLWEESTEVALAAIKPPREVDPLAAQQQRLAAQDAAIKRQISMAEASHRMRQERAAQLIAQATSSGANSSRERAKREKAERKAAEKRAKADAKATKKWVSALPTAGLAERHAALSARIDAGRRADPAGFDRVEQQQQQRLDEQGQQLREADSKIAALAERVNALEQEPPRAVAALTERVSVLEQQRNQPRVDWQV
jgi:hypothetical protein